MESLPDYNKITFANSNGVPWKNIVPNVSQETLSLIKSFLQYNHENRPSAQDVSKL